jgi:hypothetical protein
MQVSEHRLSSPLLDGRCLGGCHSCPPRVEMILRLVCAPLTEAWEAGSAASSVLNDVDIAIQL